MGTAEIHQFLTHLAVVVRLIYGTGSRIEEAMMLMCSDGCGKVLLPDALARKYVSAAQEWVWQWVFPQQYRWRNQQTGTQGRHHLDKSVIQKAVRRAVLASRLSKPAGCHTFRHS